MTVKETVASEELEMDALTLGDFISTHIINDHDDAKTVVHVTDSQGRQFTRVSLIKEMLSDGSHVYDLVLSE
jgi:hypothetical protein